MKKLFKVGITVIVLFLVLIIVLPFVIPLDRLKPIIIEKAEEQISGDLEIGKISLRFIPFIGLKLDNVTLANKPDSPFQGAPIIKLPRFDFHVHLKSLFKMRVIAGLKIEKPEIFFTKLPSGKSNIDSLLEKPLAPVPATPPPAEPPLPTPTTSQWQLQTLNAQETVNTPTTEVPEATPPPSPEEVKKDPVPATSGSPLDNLPVKIEVTEIRIDEAQITVTDQATKEPPLTLRDLNIKISNIKPQDPNAPISLEIGTKIFGSPKENLSLKGQIFVDLAKKIVTVPKADLLIAGSPIHVEAKVENYDTNPAFAASLSAPTFKFASIDEMAPAALKALPPESSIGGSMGLAFSASGTPSSVKASGELNFENTSIAYGKLFRKNPGQNLKITLDVASTPAQLTIKQIALSILGDAIIMEGTIQMTDQQDLNILIDSKALNIQKLLTLSPAYASMPVQGVPSFEITATGATKNPDSVNLSGNVVAKKITYDKYTIDNLSTHFGYANKTARLHDLDLDIFSGHLFGAAVVDLQKDMGWQLDLKLSDIDINQVLTTVGNAGEVLTGRGGLSLAVTGTGTDITAIKKTLSGQGGLSLHDGTFKTANISKGVLSPQTLGALQTGLGLAGTGIKIPEALVQYTDTSFKLLETSFTIVNGVIQVPQIHMAQNDYSINLAGTINLDLELNMKGDFLLTPARTSELIPDEKTRSYFVNADGQFTIPFTLTGPVTNPNVAPDASFIGDIAKRALTGIAQEKAKQLVQEQVQKAVPQLGGLLQNTPLAQPSSPTPTSPPPSAGQAVQNKAAETLKGLFGR
ncbi:MAG: hypothetical protein A3I75_02730 [Deltaproteobacteria bacterium RIFCSPLOWO2_02_FULL_50_16]|nr:MAG: hypothetical protein A2053_01695 [Deltaproteobacteria bacterium GWA2_50_8]OGQ30298.1 MAG: hypothetical protein A3B79_05200 [Deltaproteobacteria bacterium RIFCSPHIGHO2_02_FULL_50_15]OGQ56138.1 MAG: hypothetical protein A3I75_02730 [Deltaproteobacteria bacterium RIFCSPLOWO2_02_FULL_50_16]OGQ66020.1 MAG: hypothetical protein A3F89_04735 [Deltaproteobacteria bacterium RIFCSPLOWO2_12_FULL_50_11]